MMQEKIPTCERCGRRTPFLALGSWPRWLCRACWLVVYDGPSLIEAPVIGPDWEEPAVRPAGDARDGLTDTEVIR